MVTLPFEHIPLPPMSPLVAILGHPLPQWRPFWTTPKLLFKWEDICLDIYVSVSKPSIYFWKRVISTKWRNKLLVHNISLTGHRKSACCLRPWISWRQESSLYFVIGGPRFFLKGCYHYHLKAFCEIVYNSVL